MDAFLVTGAAGYLGSKILIGLLRRGELAIAALRGARPIGGVVDPSAPSPEVRIRGVLRGQGVANEEIDRWLAGRRLQVVGYDIEALLDQPAAKETFLREARAVLAASGAELAEVIHVAADLSMAKGPGRKEKSMRRNAYGTRVTCELAIALGARRFTDISTWYVCGSGEVLNRVRTRAELEAMTWLNHYQESKAWGEREAEDAVAASGKAVQLRIVRPSIVVHDMKQSDTGWNRAEQHFLHNALLRLYLRRVLRNLPGPRSVYMPPPLEREQAMNVVPVEQVVGALLDLIGRDAAGIFHLSDPSPKPLHRWLEHTFRLYYPRDNLEVRYGERPRHRSRLLRALRKQLLANIVGDLSQVIPFAGTAFSAGGRREFDHGGMGAGWAAEFPTIEEIKLGFLVEALQETASPGADPLWSVLRAAKDRRVLRKEIERWVSAPSASFAAEWKRDVLEVLEDRGPDLEGARRYLYLMLGWSPAVLSAVERDPEFASRLAAALRALDARAFLEAALASGLVDGRAFRRISAQLLASKSSGALAAERREVLLRLMGADRDAEKLEREVGARP
jgi:nucleoside-diphosphate-sugar epimerase